jgi:8-oxo-dGTP pyrophosphatase MutT (NUDIX family)
MASSLFNPLDLPPLKIDDHLPKVDPSHLLADALRARFRTPPDWSPELAVERQLTQREPAQASVLIPLVQNGGELRVLLTQRTDHLTHHPGQVSFPGGRAEPEDVDAVTTALREAWEEIGLHADFVEVLGQLPLYTTATGFVVTPVVALVRPGFRLTTDPNEVAHLFDVPLSFLMAPANHRWHAVEMGGVPREFLSMLWREADECGLPREHLVWGATAAMLRNLYRFLLAEVPSDTGRYHPGT